MRQDIKILMLACLDPCTWAIMTKARSKANTARVMGEMGEGVCARTKCEAV
jgi:hypothetical protein